jgi:hypothetical protein
MNNFDVINLIHAKNAESISRNYKPQTSSGVRNDIGKIIYDRKIRNQFEQKTLIAARGGLFHIAEEVMPLPIEQLVQEGFYVKEVVRNKSLLHSLESACENAEIRALGSADRFISGCPQFHAPTHDQFLHRNALYSFIKIIWDQNLLTETTTTHDFENLLRIYTNLNEDQIISNRFLLKSVVDEFKSFKMATAQANEIKAEYDLLPVNLDRAYVIQWLNVCEYSSVSKKEFVYSTEVLKWYSLNWVNLLDWLNQCILRHARYGSDFCEISVTMENEKIVISDDYYVHENEHERESLAINQFPMSLLYKKLVDLDYLVVMDLKHYDDDYCFIGSQSVSGVEFNFSANDELSIVLAWK